MEDYEFKKYKKVHKFKYPSEEETSKIKREKLTYSKYKNKAKNMIKNISKMLNNEELASIHDDLEFRAKKVIGNARVHKQRLKKLENNQDFD